MILKNASTISFDPPCIRMADLRIDGGIVVESGTRLAALREEHVVDLNGKLLMAGLVCAHTHLYSSLARGMPGPKSPPRNFPDLLKKVWWKLDSALDEESIYYSALVGALEAVQCGTTALVDHHASPDAIPGSLDIIREAVENVGLRAVLCYEVTDRGGRKRRDQGLEENDRFIRLHATHPRVRGMVGAHASFTLSEESLRLCSRLAEAHETGVHLHVAEDRSDVQDARKRRYRGVVPRLQAHGILSSRAILAHCIHLSPDEFRTLRRVGSWLVHNPRSNMNNSVGHAPLQWFGERAALGTDGFPADMLEEVKFSYFRNQEDDTRKARRPVRRTEPGSARLLSGGQKLISELFGLSFGSFDPGAVADFVVLNYSPPTPLNEDNLFSHLVSAMRSSMVESVMIDGKWVVKERSVLNLNVEDVYRKSSEVSARLWSRIYG